MQHLISWKEYLSYSGICLFIYYLFIALRFYRNDLLHLKLSSPSSKNAGLGQGPLFKAMKPKESSNEDPDEITSAIEEFVDELDVLLRQSAAQKLAPSEVIEAIIKLTKKYPVLSDISNQQSLTGLVETQAQNICKINLSEPELASIWK